MYVDFFSPSLPFPSYLPVSRLSLEFIFIVRFISAVKSHTEYPTPVTGSLLIDKILLEVVRAFNWVIKTLVFYWATSEWTAREIEEAWHIADSLGLRGPIAERCEHHMFHRERPEKYNVRTMTFSPLANGVLTDKVNLPYVPK
ncbi:hypothetical protein AGABI1DRAFT_124600 [Agaricus bisporus var. burnettii JB137-S8]|uniref:Uncharacterized protein n=1 Tax=Agaricus bisporus var. burnettii (strain JB137-S8 / ATCC MYA-4627 / FGSC 10392) TaxID=597362 RepID=K5WBJ4_AGABU|nr:uncharacterized protein AGABI1DRAFT_124600 [Agaricus bisporus var. burnettii JB137-S8]EKM84279.1 hypothetical protein AGABI1DRAFT_124600 [Agaricus bisporus var. burnettii JB137-S8]